MQDTNPNKLPELVRTARARLTQDYNASAQVFDRFERELQELRQSGERLKESVARELDALAQFEPPAPPPSAEASLEELLSSVQNLMTTTLPEQVFDVLSEESQKSHARAAVFDVRGKAAWGIAARGFGGSLSEKTLHALAIPLNHEGPFRKVFETGSEVQTVAEELKRAKHLIEKFRPAHQAAILLLPIRSAGSVSAILYADMGESGLPLPANTLKILTEFAGAQLDRLMALGGEGPAPESVALEAEPAEPAAEEQEQTAAPDSAEEIPVATATEQVALETTATSAPAVESPAEPAPAPVESGETAAAPAAVAESAPVEAAAQPETGQLSEEEEKVLRDARRFSKLLVSEIELYNKAKVSEGRKNKDLYRRLKSDIERSRQTYEKRFGKTVARQFDCFHEELVRTLAGNDASLLGSDYTGPIV